MYTKRFTVDSLVGPSGPLSYKADRVLILIHWYIPTNKADGVRILVHWYVPKLEIHVSHSSETDPQCKKRIPAPHSRAERFVSRAGERGGR